MAGLKGRLFFELLAPAAIGALTGACVAAATHLVEDLALGALASLPGALPALFSPAALLVTLLVSRFVTRAEGPATSELYILTYHRPEQPFPLTQVPGRLLGAATTVGFGGSQGFESASALIGVSLGDLLTRVRSLRISVDARRSLLAAGASGGIAAVFSSPAVGALYGIEVPFRRDIDAPRLAPCAVAAVCSYAVRDELIGTRRLVEAAGLPAIDTVFVAACLAVAVACGGGAWLFARFEELLREVGGRQTRLQRALVGGAVLGTLAWVGHEICGSWITFGPGYIAADWLMRDEHLLWISIAALAIRAGGNLACVYGGGGGGVFTSLACNGLFIGQIVAVLAGRTETRMLPLLGAACFLANGYRLPLAAMLLIGEQAGDLPVAALGLVAVAIGQVMMGARSVSDAQADRRSAGGALDESRGDAEAPGG